MKRKSLIVGIVIAVVLLAKVVSAAPNYVIQRTILPETNGLYELGSSTKLWLTGFFGTTTNRYGRTSILPIDTASTTIVRAGMYTDAASSGSNFCVATTPFTSKTCLYTYHTTRVRQTGDITKVGLYFRSKPAQVTGFYIQFWRQLKGTNTWVLATTTEDIWPSVSGGSVNTITLTTPVGVNEGDFPAVYYTMSADPGAFLDRQGAAATYYEISNSVPTVTGYDFTGGTSGSNGVAFINLFERAPMFAVIGDSIVSGANDTFTTTVSHRSYLETTDHNNRENSFPYQLGKRLGWNYQNMGISGDSIAGITARLQTDLIALNPKVAIMEGGTNDTSNAGGGGASVATLIANYTTNLNAVVAAGITPVVLSVPPDSAGNTAGMQKRDLFNAALKALVATYPTATYVDLDPVMGKYRSGGDNGNLWDWRPQYTDDFLHPSAIGYAAMADAVADAIAKHTIKGNLETGDVTVNGNITLTANGANGSIIRGGRPLNFDQLAPPLRIEGFGPPVGQYSSNKQGGILELAGGPSIGTGSSSINFLTTAAGSSGVSENVPTQVGTFSGAGNFGIATTSPYDWKYGSDGVLQWCNHYSHGYSLPRTMGLWNCRFFRNKRC
jgi:lysophospholipase L1-like esterase